MSGKNGKFIIPTGTGKTYVEVEVVRRVILDIQQKKNGIPKIKVNSSRILLCYQLFEEFFTYLNAYGIQAKYINFNSGSPDEKKYAAELRKAGGIYRSIVSTTSCKEVKEAYAAALKEGIPLIIFSTYHSSEKFAESGLVPDVTIHDEAHNLVSNEFTKVASLPSGANLFFTATEKITDGDNGLGMNNSEIFGEITYTKSAKQMIDKGEMVSPHMHIVRAKQKVDLDKIDSDYEALITSIADAFFAHDKMIKNESYNSSEIGAKILVVCRGQLDLQEMFKTDFFANFRTQYPDIHLFALSSDFGIYNDDEGFSKPPVTNSKKHQLMKSVKSLNPSDKCIIFHVDMIGEGIDVPGITGVMPFRNCELAKFVQNIGRASRLHHKDRKRLYDGEIFSSDRSKWIKPHSWVIVPSFLENSEGMEDRFREIINVLRNDFGFIPKQHTVIDNNKGLEDDDEIDTVNDKVKDSPHTNSGLTDFTHEFEDISLFEKIINEDEVSLKTAEIEKSLYAFVEEFKASKAKK